MDYYEADYEIDGAGDYLDIDLSEKGVVVNGKLFLNSKENPGLFSEIELETIEACLKDYELYCSRKGQKFIAKNYMSIVRNGFEFDGFFSQYSLDFVKDQVGLAYKKASENPITSQLLETILQKLNQF